MKTILRKNYIVKIALLSRLSVIIIQYVFNHIIPDHKATAFLYPKENQIKTVADKIVEHFFGGFLRWDAQYMMHIAIYGYTYENITAFFPLFPLIGSFLAKCLSFQEFLSIESTLTIIFLTINIVIFVYSALTLFELGCKLFPEKLAYYSTILFCWNPASIFFTAPYTECLFSYLSFKSMLNCILLYEKYHKLKSRIIVQDILYLFPIALSGITRSNGVLNTGFFLYSVACIFFQTFNLIVGNKFMKIVKRISLILAFSIITIFGVIFCVFPFDLYQIYCYKLFCTDFASNISLALKQFADENNFVVFGTFSQHNQSWCHNKLPLAYSYVQSHYWNVGFLKYYEFKQIPNFLLALPILSIFMYNCLKFICRNREKIVYDLFSFDPSHIKYITFYENSNLYVYIIHGLTLSIFCIFFVHIQVSTRFLCSASPLLYWFCAFDLIEDGKFCDIREFKQFSFKRKFIILYYLIYFVIGTVLFSNFLPWT